MKRNKPRDLYTGKPGVDLMTPESQSLGCWKGTLPRKHLNAQKEE